MTLYARLGIAAAVLLAVLGLLWAIYARGQADQKRDTDAAVAIATVEVLKTDGTAKEVAAVERQRDDIAIAEKKEELTDAVADLPDTLPSTRRVALGCARLRAAGTDTAALAACR